MNDHPSDLDKAEKDVLTDDVSDDALETAAGAKTDGKYICLAYSSPSYCHSDD